MSFTDLRDESFICLPLGSGLHAILTAAASNENVQPRVQLEAPTPAGIREFVAAGLGVALLARSAAQAPGPPVAINTLANPPHHPPIGLIYRGDRALTSAALACRHHLTSTQIANG